MRLVGFDPIIADQPKAIILGSMPSVTSLDKQEYYGFQHNRFWKIMAAYFHKDFTTYEDKIQCIKEHHLILWDVIGSCEREGSLDSAIRNEICNDIIGILQRYPQIQLVICNGKKSYDLYQRHFAKQTDIECVCLPSTSNANRTIKETALFEQWFAQLQRIDDRGIE